MAGVNIACDNCQAGTYKALAGVNIACDNCPAGKYKGAAGINTVSEDCAAGDFEGSVGETVCTGNCQMGKYSKVTGAISADTCKECPIGTYGNTTGASSCDACPVDETTTVSGNSDPAACECKPGYTRDCTTQDCTACATGELFFAGACEACPEGGSCDGSDQVSCQTGFYKFHPTTHIRPVCHQCPAGAECRTGTLMAKVPGSIWENKSSPDGIQSYILPAWIRFDANRRHAPGR